MSINPQNACPFPHSLPFLVVVSVSVALVVSVACILFMMMMMMMGLGMGMAEQEAVHVQLLLMFSKSIINKRNCVLQLTNFATGRTRSVRQQDELLSCSLDRIQFRQQTPFSDLLPCPFPFHPFPSICALASVGAIDENKTLKSSHA